MVLTVVLSLISFGIGSVEAGPQAKRAVVKRRPAVAQHQKLPAENPQLSSTIQSLRTQPTSSATLGSMGRGGTHEIGEAMRVTGQSRSLSMGLLFSKDGDQIEFGSPRMHYKDKISSAGANY